MNKSPLTVPTMSGSDQRVAGLLAALNRLASHPSYKDFVQMSVGPYTMPSQPRSNEDAAKLQECIHLHGEVLREAEKLGIPVNASEYLRQHPEIPV